MKKLLLTLLLLLSLGFAASAQGSADLSTINGGKTVTVYSSYTTENGWKVTNSLIANAKVSAIYPVLNGKTSAVGTLTSPTLTGGVGSVTIKCVYPYSESNGFKFILNIKQGDAVVATQTFTDSSNATAEFTSNVFDVAGDFVIEIKNGSPSNNTSNKDRLGIYELTWTGYTENVGTEKIDLVQDNLVVKAGDVVIEDEEEVELDANTVVTFAYSTDVENADIAYSYSVNGEDAIEGKSYTFTGEDDVIFTATATSNNEVSKTVYLLKKYPTECPQPVFSVADGAEVYAGQIITVKADGAESILLEANEVLQDGTSYVVAGEPGDVITLYALASVTGKNGAITAENSITVTVVEATETTFTFAGENGSGYGMTPQTNSNTYETEVTEIKSGIVTINFTGNYRYWNNDKTLRIMSGATFTISVPEDYYIESIDFDGTSSAASPDYGSLSSGKWTNLDVEKSAVVFNRGTSGKVELKAITIKYAKYPETELVAFTHEESFGRTVVRVEYMLHLNNHKDANVYTVELTVGDNTFSNTEHSDASIVEETANAPMRALNPDDVASETTLKGTIMATGLEPEKEYGTANVAVKLGDNVIHNATIENFTTGTTGIEDVTVENEAAAEYFNMQGIRVAQPEAGQIYIVRRGAKATKELVK